MKRANLLKFSVLILSAILLVGVSAFKRKMNIDKLSFDMSARTLYQGKSVHGNGEVYYRVKGGLMVTKMNYPVNQLIITNTMGEYKSYDLESNTVVLSTGSELSSKHSFLYSFLSGEIGDMGLSHLGYRLADTKIENDLVIKTYNAPEDRATPARKVELVFEDFLPIYAGFIDAQGKTIQKTYYSNYQNVSYIRLPLTITEVNFMAENDSSITQRKYSNLKFNQNVDERWLNFQIPQDARVIDADQPIEAAEE